MVKSIIIILALVLVYYILYINGYMVFNFKRAASYIGSSGGKRRCQAKFSTCSGMIKRVIKFEESKSYQFELDANLSAGEFLVEVLDRRKQPLLTLTTDNPTGEIEVKAKERYFLVFKFVLATGNYVLTWK